MRRFLLVLLLVLPAAARAQVLSVYGTFSPAHLSNVATGAVYTTTGFKEATTSYLSYGVGGGITANFLPLGPVRFGFDLRGSTKPGISGADSALFGIKVSVHPPVLRIKPYGQVSIGYLASRTTNLSTPSGQTSGAIGGIFSNQYAIYEIMGGVDYPLIGPLDFRVIEIGGGKGILQGNTNNPTFITVNTGLVLHF